MGWNDLSQSQQSAFKAKNFNKNIRVSEQTIQKLRAGKTFENNIAAYKRTGGNAQTLEGMNRFYGKARVSGALGNSLRNTSIGKSKPPTAQHATNGNTKPKTNPTILKTPKAPKPNGPGFNIGRSTGNFIKNELLGVDDFSKLRGEMKQHRYGAMAKSALAGSLELGTTAAAIFGSVFTGGGTLAAEVGAKSAMLAARQVGKEALKTGVSKAVGKASLKGAAKTAATGSLKGGAKNVGKTALKVVRPIKATKTAVRGAVSVVRKQALKNNTGMTASRAIVRQSTEASAKAAEKAAASTAASKTAQQSAKNVAKKYSSKLTHAGKRTTAAGKAGAIRSANATAKRAIATGAKDRAAAMSAKNASTAANAVVKKAVTDRAKKVAAVKARNKVIKKGIRRSQVAHVGAHYGTEGWYSTSNKKGKK